MASGTYISINTATIGTVSAQAASLGTSVETTRNELISLQGELSEAQNVIGNYLGICYDDAIPTKRLMSQKSAMEEIVSLLAQAEQLAEEASNNLNTKTSALQLAVEAMKDVSGTAYATALSVISAALSGETDTGDDWAYTGLWGSSPLKKTAKITSKYGPRNLYGSFHYGVDFGVSEGTQVVAPISGTVVKAYTQSGGGNCIYLLGDDGYLYEFAHLQTFQCKQGDRVEVGDNIALSGKTGAYVTGAHLHFGVYKADEALKSGNKLNWKTTSSGDWYLPGSVDPVEHFKEKYDIDLGS